MAPDTDLQPGNNGGAGAADSDSRSGVALDSDQGAPAPARDIPASLAGIAVGAPGSMTAVQTSTVLPRGPRPGSQLPGGGANVCPNTANPYHQCSEACRAYWSTRGPSVAVAVKPAPSSGPAQSSRLLGTMPVDGDNSGARSPQGRLEPLLGRSRKPTPAGDPRTDGGLTAGSQLPSLRPTAASSQPSGASDTQNTNLQHCKPGDVLGKAGPTAAPEPSVVGDGDSNSTAIQRDADASSGTAAVVVGVSELMHPASGCQVSDIKDRIPANSRATSAAVQIEPGGHEPANGAVNMTTKSIERSAASADAPMAALHQPGVASIDSAQDNKVALVTSLNASQAATPPGPGLGAEPSTFGAGAPRAATAIDSVGHNVLPKENEISFQSNRDMAGAGRSNTITPTDLGGHDLSLDPSQVLASSRSNVDPATRGTARNSSGGEIGNNTEARGMGDQGTVPVSTSRPNDEPALEHPAPQNVEVLDDYFDQFAVATSREPPSLKKRSTRGSRMSAALLSGGISAGGSSGSTSRAHSPSFGGHGSGYGGGKADPNISPEATPNTSPRMTPDIPLRAVDESQFMDGLVENILKGDDVDPRAELKNTPSVAVDDSESQEPILWPASADGKYRSSNRERLRIFKQAMRIGRTRAALGVPARHIVVIYNPVSGGGASKRLVDHMVGPVFKLAKVDFTAIRTEYAGFAISYVAGIDPTTVCACHHAKKCMSQSHHIQWSLLLA